MVVEVDDSFGGLSFTIHCAAGLSLETGIFPLATGEMSCLLPFPYTPKPNKQHGAGIPVFALSSLHTFSSSIRLLPLGLSYVLWFVTSLSPTLFAPLAINPPLKPTIYLALPFMKLMFSPCSSLCGLTTQWPADSLIRSKLSLSHSRYTYYHTSRGFQKVTNLLFMHFFIELLYITIHITLVINLQFILLTDNLHFFIQNPDGIGDWIVVVDTEGDNKKEEWRVRVKRCGGQYQKYLLSSN